MDGRKRKRGREGRAGKAGREERRKEEGKGSTTQPSVKLRSGPNHTTWAFSPTLGSNLFVPQFPPMPCPFSAQTFSFLCLVSGSWLCGLSRSSVSPFQCVMVSPTVVATGREQATRRCPEFMHPWCAAPGSRLRRRADDLMV